jgi:hypothetical protein
LGVLCKQVDVIAVASGGDSRMKPADRWLNLLSALPRMAIGAGSDGHRGQGRHGA